MHSRQPTQSISLSESSLSIETEKPTPLVFCKIEIAARLGLYSPLCLKEHAISHVVQPVQEGISNFMLIIYAIGDYKLSQLSDLL